MQVKPPVRAGIGALAGAGRGYREGGAREKGKEGVQMSDDGRHHHEYERIVVSGEGATAREIRIYGSEGR